MDSNPTPPAPPQPKSSNAGLIIGIVIAVLVGGVFVVGILASLAIYGMRGYLQKAKTAEGLSAVQAIAHGAAACGQSEPDPTDPTAVAGLPPTTTPVPASLGDVQGKKYMSAPSEWRTPGWDCIKFEMSTPQLFQYQWVRTSATSGFVRGVADLDGDGAPDVQLESQVTCESSPTMSCTAARVQEKR